VAWHAALKVQSTQEMGSASWAGDRAVSELVRVEYQASEQGIRNGVGRPSRLAGQRERTGIATTGRERGPGRMRSPSYATCLSLSGLH
jgi:hypothetical protein